MNRKWIHSLLASVMAVSSFTVTNVHAVSSTLTNWAKDGTVNHFTNEETSNKAVYAIDGNLDTRWSTLENTKQSELEITLKDGQPKLVNHIRVTFEDIDKKTTGGQTNITGFEIWAIKEGESEYKKIGEKTSGVEQVNELMVSATYTKKLKLKITGITEDSYQNTGVVEFEVYSKDVVDSENTNHLLKNGGNVKTITATHPENQTIHKKN